jgi:16S rRNA (uracil1498-N3)-methyltransferase
MNLVLIEEQELASDGTARLSGRRAAHVLEVLGATDGDRILAGVIGGRMGDAEVLVTRPDEVVLAPRFDRNPPPALPISLLVALPRPKILRRVLQAAASMGVKRIVLLGSWRVEKSYWSSPLLLADAVREQLLLGLEQGRDTILPDVAMRRFFKPFVEDELDATFAGAQRLLAHPCDSRLEGIRPDASRVVIAIGPEGGWTPYEARELENRRFVPFSLGPRILRVDTAVPFAIGSVEHWLVPGTRARDAGTNSGRSSVTRTDP